MRNFLCLTYYVLNFTLVFFGISFLGADDQLIHLLMIAVYMILWYTSLEHKIKAIQKNYVERNLYNKLYERYIIYKKYNEYLSPDDAEKIQKMDNAYTPFDDDNELEKEYSNKFYYR